MNDQQASPAPGKNLNWGTIIIVGLIVWIGVAYVKKKIEEERQAQIDRENAEVVGALVGGAIKEMSK